MSSMLPRPHHDLNPKKVHSTALRSNAFNSSKMGDFKNKNGYESENIGYDNQEEKRDYQPVPDGRFYTKANFFTLQDREQIGMMTDKIKSISNTNSGFYN